MVVSTLFSTRGLLQLRLFWKEEMGSRVSTLFSTRGLLQRFGTAGPASGSRSFNPLLYEGTSATGAIEDTLGGQILVSTLFSTRGLLQPEDPALVPAPRGVSTLFSTRGLLQPAAPGRSFAPPFLFQPSSLRGDFCNRSGCPST